MLDSFKKKFSYFFTIICRKINKDAVYGQYLEPWIYCTYETSRKVEVFVTRADGGGGDDIAAGYRG